MGKFHLPKAETMRPAIKMAWPAIIESFFTALTAMIDSLMVSGLGSGPVAAVGLTTQPKFIALAPFIATNVAVSALVARRRGEKRREDANTILITALTFALFAGIIASIVFVSFADPIITLCGSNADTHDDAVTYCRIIMGGMIFNCLQLSINAAQRGSGNTKITMRTHITSNTVNLIFNFLLIEGNLGFPAMGIAGAALATVLGAAAACVMAVISILNKSCFVNIPFIIKNKLRPRIEAFKNLVQVGYGIFFEQLLLRVGFMATALMAADQGTDALAAHQVGTNIMSLSFSFGDGLQAAAVALIGYSLGEKDPDKAKEYGRSCRFIGACISAVLAVTYFFGARFIYSLFFVEETIIEYGVHITYIILVTCVFQIAQVIYMGCLRGAGDIKFTAFASTICVTVIRTVSSYAFCYILGFGIEGIWLGVLTDQIGRFILSTIRFKQGKWINIHI